jgi:hypothetical protein
MCSLSVRDRLLCTYMMNRQMHIYKYIQEHISVVHQHVSVTAVPIIRMLYNKHKISIQIIVQKCTIKPLTVTFDILN